MQLIMLTDSNESELSKIIFSIKSTSPKITGPEIALQINNLGWRTRKSKLFERQHVNYIIGKYSVVAEIDNNLLGFSDNEPVTEPKQAIDLKDSIFLLYQELHRQGEAYKAIKEKIKTKQELLNDEDKTALLTKIYWQIPTFPDSWLKSHFNFSSTADLSGVVGTCEDVRFFCSQCDEIIEIKSRQELAELQQNSDDGLNKICHACKRIHELRSMAHAEYILTNEWKEIRLKHLGREGNNKCQTCSAVNNLVVHHNNYNNKGQEKPGDLVTLRNDCHNIFHSNQKVTCVYDTGAIWTSKKKI